MQIYIINLMFWFLLYCLSDSFYRPSYFRCHGKIHYSPSKSPNSQEESVSTYNKKQDLATRIMAGTASGEHHHVVRIALKSDFETARCAGTIHNAVFIITVAHCVNKVDVSQLIVTAGLDTNGLEQNRSVVSVKIHDNWNSQTLEHNIALLTLNNSLVLSANEVGPVELGQPELPNMTLSKAWITGFGLWRGGDVTNLTYPTYPRQAKARFVDRDTCEKVYNKLGKVLYEDQICAGGEKGIGPCTGDDGAPLTLRYYYGPLDRLFVTGILSSFKGCATEIPQIYTDLNKYKSWVALLAGRQCDYNIHAYNFENLQSKTTYETNSLQRPKGLIQGSVAQAVCIANHNFIHSRYIQGPLKSSALQAFPGSQYHMVKNSDLCINWQWKSCYKCQKFKSVKCSFDSQNLELVATTRQTSRVLQGHDASPHQHPYQIRIVVTTDGRVNQYKCSGAIYNSFYVITAAWCVYKLIPCQITVIAGDHSVSVTEESEQVRHVVSIINHEKYDHSILRSNNIALLKIDIPFNYSTKNVQPVPLAAKEYPTAMVQQVELSGWGQLSHAHNRPDILQTVEIPFIDECDCKLEYSSLNGNPITSKTFCAGRVGQGFCDYDEGSPLTVKDNGSRYLIGITSSTATCGNAPGIATKLYAYREWITLRAG